MRTSYRHLTAALAATAIAGRALATLPVNLGTAGSYCVLAETAITTTGTTAVVGNMGISPNSASSITGFGLTLDSSGTFARSSLVNGKVYAATYTAPTPINLGVAIGDMTAAYTDAAGRAPGATELYAGDISGKTLAPGVYKWSTNVWINTDITLSGSATDVWIFEIAQDLLVANGAHVNLSGGAQASNIFWQVGGGTGATLGTTSIMNGNILSAKQVIVKTGATLNGRALAQTQVTLDAGLITSPDGFAGANAPAAGKTFEYPSPVRNGVMHLVYRMAESGTAAIRIWNERGDLSAQQEDHRPAGPQETRIQIATFAPGIYLYKIILTYDSGRIERLDAQKFAVVK